MTSFTNFKAYTQLQGPYPSAMATRVPNQHQYQGIKSPFFLPQQANDVRHLRGLHILY